MKKLRLYISNNSTKTQNSIRNLRTILERRFSTDFSLEIIDIMEHPEACARDTIFATPTLIKYEPLPARKIIGDVDDEERMITALELP